MAFIDLFNDNDRKPVALPVYLLRCSICDGIQNHIAVKIRRLVREFQDEYTKWKHDEPSSHPPPPFDEHPEIPLRSHEKLRPGAAWPSSSYKERWSKKIPLFLLGLFTAMNSTSIDSDNS